MKLRQFKPALIAGALLATAYAGSAAAYSDTLWDDIFAQNMARLEMMKMYDANSDHTVDKTEFMHHADMMFAKMDADSNGVIDEDEWGKLIRLSPKY